MKTLIIDDEEPLRTLMGKFLQSNLNTEVVEAENGRDGLEKALIGNYDLIVTDVSMPEMNGVELLLSLLSIKPRQKIFVATGSSGQCQFKELDKFKGLVVLPKPFSKEIFLEAVRKALNSEIEYEGIGLRSDMTGCGVHLKAKINEKHDAVVRIVDFGGCYIESKSMSLFSDVKINSSVKVHIYGITDNLTGSVSEIVNKGTYTAIAVRFDSLDDRFMKLFFK